MDILLTGCDGFIGKHLNTYLSTKHKIIGLDVKSGNDLLVCDLNYSVDLVIHLAARSGIKDSLNNPTDYWKNNVIASKRLFDYFKNTKILYASSSTAYEPFRNPYAMSKYAMEQIAPNNSLGMRFTTAYGPGARESMLIPRILRNDLEYINTNHSRDFIHVNDIVSAIDVLIDSHIDTPYRYNGVIDVGTGITNTLTSIIDRFKLNVKRLEGDEHERLDNKADINILNDLGWKPKYELITYIEKNNL